MEKETLEEAAEKEYPIHNALQHSTEYKANIAEKRLAFIFGAKWQAERMYSRQDLIDFVYYINGRYYSKFIVDTDEVDLFIEQLKEK